MDKKKLLQDADEIAAEVDRIYQLPPDSPELKVLRDMMQELNEGLPP